MDFSKVKDFDSHFTVFGAEDVENKKLSTEWSEQKHIVFLLACWRSAEITVECIQNYALNVRWDFFGIEIDNRNSRITDWIGIGSNCVDRVRVVKSTTAERALDVWNINLDDLVFCAEVGARSFEAPKSVIGNDSNELSCKYDFSILFFLNYYYGTCNVHAIFLPKFCWCS